MNEKRPEDANRPTEEDGIPLPAPEPAIDGEVHQASADEPDVQTATAYVPEEAPPSQADSDYKPQPPPEPPARRGGFLSFLALLLALAGVAGAGYVWWQGQQEGAAEAARLADLDRADVAAQERLATLERRLEALDQATDAGRSELQGLESELEAARQRLASLATTTAPPGHTPRLADAEHLLLVASRELSLADNHAVALAALEEADRRLRDLGDPALLPVRQAISDDIAAIEAVASADPDGLAMRLGSLAERVQGLPLNASLAPEPGDTGGAASTDASGWERFKRRLKELASGLFRVRRMDAPPAPLLSPEESFFLYRNLELDLKTARLAAMAGDQPDYVQSLDSARDTVERFFVRDDPAVRSFLESLESLRSADVDPDWPDISGTVELLRAVAEQPGNT